MGSNIWLAALGCFVFDLILASVDILGQTVATFVSFCSFGLSRLETFLKSHIQASPE